MRYKIKRGAPADRTIQRRIIHLGIQAGKPLFLLAFLVGSLYGGGWLAYHNSPNFAQIVDRGLGWVTDLYQAYGLWTTIFLVFLIGAGGWALIDEMQRKEYERERGRDRWK
ncbi:hypothetical protein [Thalassobacillus pellis]|uniref:hypothetical protein n=1 Tax=Thalassobacillus pellis TaxID=748008 RepID=UPI0019610ECE|nr:hypothetical protein [Thalassobacillus pellis]MBM7554575.1 hypothetical protein [Thalassobacillus pellis]